MNKYQNKKIWCYLKGYFKAQLFLNRTSRHDKFRSILEIHI